MTQTDQPPYKDASLPVDERVDDLLGRMTLEEKAGQLFHGELFMLDDYHFEEGGPHDKRITDKFLTHMNLLGNIKDPKRTAEFFNKAQSRALGTRLGVPITFSTDPRHSFTQNFGTAFTADAFSQWPETLGFAALRDADLVARFADIARQEYVAVGLRAALSPQIDLSTEPRWARTSGTFGEDADLSSELAVAYIQGFQNSRDGGLGPDAVTTVTKHFPGAGPKEDGEDAHFAYGKNQIYPGGQWEYHLAPFKAAIAAGTRQMMPYYSKPVGTEYEEIGFAFNREIMTVLLREKLGFEDIILTDWSLLTDDVIFGSYVPARAWGVEELTVTERIVKLLDAGCDQFGGEWDSEPLIQAVRDGIVSEERVNVSARKILKEKFLLGLFEKPYADADRAATFVGNAEFKALGFDAQQRSFTLLTNKDVILPLQPDNLSNGVYVEGIEAALLEARGLKVVPTPEEASVALLRLEAPYRERATTFEKMFHAGSLEFTDEEKQRQAGIYSAVPTVVDVKLDRAAAIPEIAEQAAALLGSYGSSPDAFLDIVLGKASPEGKLPFDLPRSDAAVVASREDVPYDTKDPVFKFGHGLRYSA